MNSPRLPRIGLIGDGEASAAWATALSAGADLRPITERVLPPLDGLVIALGAREPFACAREALLAGVPVLVSTPFRPTSAQAAVLEELSRQRGALLRIAELFQYHPGFAFLRRLMQGREPFWKPLYLRTTSLGPLGGRGLADVASEDLAMCHALLEGTPASVTAVAQSDGAGGTGAVFVTVRYREGPLVQCTVSPVEAVEARELVAATAGRTIVLDRLAPAGSLRVLSGASEAENARPSRCANDRKRDAVTEETSRFLRAITQGDRSSANAGRWAVVAAMWRAACQSMGVGGGAVEVALPVCRPVYERPPLRLVGGGVNALRAVRARPQLTVVAS